MSQPEPRVRTLPRNASGAIYGLILITALVAAFSDDKALGPLRILIDASVTMLVFWIAHAYAEAIARRLRTRGSLGWADLRDLASTEWPMLQSALPAAIALLLGAAGVLPRDTSVDLAIGLGVAGLFLWALAIGRYAGASWSPSLFGAFVGGSLGLAIIILKILVH